MCLLHKFNSSFFSPAPNPLKNKNYSLNEKWGIFIQQKSMLPIEHELMLLKIGQFEKDNAEKKTKHSTPREVK